MGTNEIPKTNEVPKKPILTTEHDGMSCVIRNEDDLKNFFKIREENPNQEIEIRHGLQIKKVPIKDIKVLGAK
jgi:hypothetical protein